MKILGTFLHPFYVWSNSLEANCASSYTFQPLGMTGRAVLVSASVAQRESAGPSYGLEVPGSNLGGSRKGPNKWNSDSRVRRFGPVAVGLMTTYRAGRAFTTISAQVAGALATNPKQGSNPAQGPIRVTPTQGVRQSGRSVGTRRPKHFASASSSTPSKQVPRFLGGGTF